MALRGDGGIDWRHVSPRLVTARLIVLVGVLSVPVVLLVAGGLWLTPWLYAGAAGLLLAGAWGAGLIMRQVPAITYAELPGELVIRRGRVYRTLASVPYGRLQYVDMESGPLARRLGMASIELHTANPSSGGDIPGLPTAVAEELRERLSARGESQRAGL